MPYPDAPAGDACPIAACSRKRGEGKLLCGQHWGMVPPGIQREVYATWKKRKAALGHSNPSAYQQARFAHEDAKRRAIAAVEAIEMFPDNAPTFLERHPELLEELADAQEELPL